jgi:hypothetical protein
MLRRVLGSDTMFYNTLRDYSAAFAYSTANTYQFRNFIQERDGARAPIDLYEFIQQWIIGPGYPVYNIAWTQDSLNLLTVRVYQSQTNSDHFTMPLDFSAVSPTDTTKFSLINNQRTQYFTVQLDHPVVRLVFDSDAVPVSRSVVTHFRTLDVQTGPPVEDLLRVAVSDGSVKLSFLPVVSESADVRILDVLGRTVMERAVQAGGTVLSFPEHNLPNGDYFAILMDGVRHATVRFQVIQ